VEVWLLVISSAPISLSLLFMNLFHELGLLFMKSPASLSLVFSSIWPGLWSKATESLPTCEYVSASFRVNRRQCLERECHAIENKVMVQDPAPADIQLIEPKYG
jgi:hypothetical protein